MMLNILKNKYLTGLEHYLPASETKEVFLKIMTKVKELIEAKYRIVK